MHTVHADAGIELAALFSYRDHLRFSNAANFRSPRLSSFKKEGSSKRNSVKRGHPMSKLSSCVKRSLGVAANLKGTACAEAGVPSHLCRKSELMTQNKTTSIAHYYAEQQAQNLL
jgi:hypothetical protein